MTGPYNKEEKKRRDPHRGRAMCRHTGRMPCDNRDRECSHASLSHRMLRTNDKGQKLEKQGKILLHSVSEGDPSSQQLDIRLLESKTMRQ